MHLTGRPHGTFRGLTVPGGNTMHHGERTVRISMEKRMWRAAAAWVQLLAGLFGFGVAVPLMIHSGLGLGPWDAFHVGIHNLTGISVGTAVIAVGLVIVVGGLSLGIRPGPGTVANMVLVGIFIDLVLPFVPEARNWGVGLLYYSSAIVIVGLSTGMYMAARLGNGPRDGLMLGLSLRHGWPFRRVRTAVEIIALTGGWAMGGAVGFGTVLFALTSGSATQIGLQLFGVIPARTVSIPAVQGDGFGSQPL